MSREDEFFDPAEVAAAEMLDAQITATLHGRAATDADPAVLWLAATMRTAPPHSLYRRIGQMIRATPSRSRRLVQVSCLALAAIFVWHALSGYLFADWISRNTGEPENLHESFEGGLAFVGVAGAVAAGALDRRWVPVSLVCGVPVGLLLAARGTSEIGTFAYGALFHLIEGALALALLLAWWNHRRRAR